MPWSGTRAIPTLARTRRPIPSTSRGSSTAPSSLTATRSASPVSTSVSTMANSSPPRRATVSVWRTTSVSRAPMRVSTTSPTW